MRQSNRHSSFPLIVFCASQMLSHHRRKARSAQPFSVSGCCASHTTGTTRTRTTPRNHAIPHCSRATLHRTLTEGSSLSCTHDMTSTAMAASQGCGWHWKYRNSGQSLAAISTVSSLDRHRIVMSILRSLLPAWVTCAVHPHRLPGGCCAAPEFGAAGSTAAASEPVQQYCPNVLKRNWLDSNINGTDSKKTVTERSRQTGIAGRVMSSDGPAFFPLADECREFSTLHPKIPASESVVQVRLRALLMPLLETIFIPF
jgi:hypothetical protein